MGSQQTQNPVIQPSILNPTDSAQWEEIKKLKKSATVVEALPEAIEDLFRLAFPHIAPGSPEFTPTFAEYQKEFWQEKPLEKYGRWIYFEWNNTLVHLPESEQFQFLRTNRNRYLVTEEEQHKFYAATIGVAGLSVGSSVTNALTLAGASKKLRIADHDTLSITNLNRLYGSVCELGTSKTVNAARRIVELNPYQEVTAYPNGLTQETLPQFLTGLDIYIEEMDDILLKIKSRFLARSMGIPVLMASDNGDNTIVDVERFDLEPDRHLFHGRVEESILKNIPAKPSMAEKVRLAATIVGSDITPRTQFSLQQVGTKLPAWPQLGTAAVLSGVAITYIARRIITGQSMPSGRYEIHLDEKIDPEYRSPAATQKRATDTKDFEEALHLLYSV